MTARRTATADSDRRTFGTVRQLPSGRFQAFYSHDGERHLAPNTFPTRREANGWLATQESKLSEGAWTAPKLGQTTVASLAEEWLGSNAAKRARSLERDRGIVDKHLVPALGSKQVARVTQADVQRMVNTWSTHLGPATVARMFSTTRAMFSYARASRMIGLSPCEGVRVPRAKLVDRPTVTAAELQRLAEELPADQAPMVWLGAVLGLRWSEVAGLRVSSIDVLKGTVTVDAQLGRDGELAAPKSNAGTRRLAVPGWLGEILAEHLAARGLTAVDRDVLVFQAPEGGPLQYHNWRGRAWARACERAGLEGLRFHDLRSLAASAMVLSGVDVKTAQVRLGHANVQLTLAVYARASEAADRAAAETVGELFRPTPRGGLRAV